MFRAPHTIGCRALSLQAPSIREGLLGFSFPKPPLEVVQAVFLLQQALLLSLKNCVKKSVQLAANPSIALVDLQLKQLAKALKHVRKFRKNLDITKNNELELFACGVTPNPAGRRAMKDISHFTRHQCNGALSRLRANFKKATADEKHEIQDKIKQMEQQREIAKKKEKDEAKAQKSKVKKNTKK